MLTEARKKEILLLIARFNSDGIIPLFELQRRGMLGEIAEKMGVTVAELDECLKELIKDLPEFVHESW